MAARHPQPLADHILIVKSSHTMTVSNAEIEEIWKMVPVGTPVEIRP